MIFILLIVLIILSTRLSLRLHGTILSPWSIYIIAWLGMFAIYSLNWVDFIPIEPRTWILLVSTIVSYLLGSFLVFLPALQRIRIVTFNREDWFRDVRFARFSVFQIFVSVMGFIGFAGYYLTIHRLYGLDVLFTEPGIIRGLQSGEEYIETFFLWKFFLYLNWLAIPLVITRIVHQGRQTPWWVYIALIVHVLTSFTLVSRSQILFMLFLALFVITAAYNRSLRRWEPMLILILLIITFLHFIFAGELLGKTYEYMIDQAGAFRGPEILKPFAGFYIYIAGNIPAFQSYLYENESLRSYGLFQFLPLFKIIAGLRLISLELPSEVGEFLFIPFLFNTYTYLNVFYLDWGIVGLFVGPLLFGFFGNYLYFLACSNGRVWHVIGAAIIVHACLSSIGTNVLISVPQWEYLLFLLGLVLFTRRKRLRHRSMGVRPVNDYK